VVCHRSRQQALTTRDRQCILTRVTQATKIANQASSRDPRVGLRAVVALRRLVEQLETIQVQNARSLGWSWQEIASELHVSKQAVHKKHAGRRFLGRRK
jgi:ribosome-binding protein aMBF1 (putative translation factor)